MSQSHDISGLWYGFFRYFSAGDLGDWSFKAKIVVKEGRLTGMVVEGHVSGIGDVKAQILGSIEGNLIQFEKSYAIDSEDYSRTVSYEGRVSEDGQSIRGNWSHSESSGEFEMTRSD